jgi:phospholipase/carboxylesterase
MNLSEAPLHVHLRGGPDDRGGGHGPLVVLLHGFGAAGTDMLPLQRVLSVSTQVRFAFPEGPIDMSAALGAEARAWWPIDMAARMARIERGQGRDPEEIPAGYEAAADLVTQEIAKRRGTSPLILGGFSQGAMLALEVALRLADPPSALALLSSTLLAKTSQWERLARLHKTPVLQSHGREDPVLPFPDAERLNSHLTDAGIAVQWLPFRGGHAIPGTVLTALSQLIVSACSAVSALRE